MPDRMDRYDLLVIGRGIVGLAHALVGARGGMRVAVLDREDRAIGASVRNFGFITVTGQQAGVSWIRARRARDVWAEVAPAAGIAVLQRGLLMCARRAESEAVLDEFAAGPMGEHCRVLRGAELPTGLSPNVRAALSSPHELRVDSRTAIPRLAAHLEAAYGVTFLPPAAAHAVEGGVAHTSEGPVHASHIAVCPGPDLRTLFPAEFARRRTTLCKLHMMRVAAPATPLAQPVMSDLGLVRYLGYAGLPSLPPLQTRLRMEQPQHLADGIHLIAVANADGSLVVGDSHSYGMSPDPFQPDDVDRRILAELSMVLDMPRPVVLERWTGVYASAPDIPAFISEPVAGVRLVQVTSGTGASTAFAIAEETLGAMLAPAIAA